MGMIIEDRKRDTQLAGLFLGPFGSGYSDNVGQLAGAEQLAELSDHKGGGGTGAEAEDHAALDVVDGFIGGEFFEVVLSESRG